MFFCLFDHSLMGHVASRVFDVGAVSDTPDARNLGPDRTRGAQEMERRYRARRNARLQQTARAHLSDGPFSV